MDLVAKRNSGHSALLPYYRREFSIRFIRGKLSRKEMMQSVHMLAMLCIRSEDCVRPEKISQYQTLLLANRKSPTTNMAAVVIQNANERAADVPNSFWGRIFPFLRMFLLWYGFSAVMKALIPQPQQNSDTIASTPLKTDSAKTILTNSFRPNDPMELHLFITAESESLPQTFENAIIKWSQSNITYSPKLHNHTDGNGFITKTFYIDGHDLSAENDLYYVHILLSRKGIPIESMDPMDTLHQSIPLTVYRPPPVSTIKRNLVSKIQADFQPQSSTLIPMWKPELIINYVYDDTVYSNDIPPFIQKHLITDFSRGLYAPILYPNEFWLLEDRLLPMNRSGRMPLEINFYPIPLWKFALYHQMTENLALQESSGSTSRKDSDKMKRLFLETNPYLLTATMLVSVLHSVFDFLAFKNDVSFWRNQKSLEGISLRTTILNTIFQLVIFLYLFDNDTSWMILFSSLIGFLIDLWKIKKALRFQQDKNTKKWSIVMENSYRESATAQYDRFAITHLTFVLYPLLVGNAAYNLLFREHKSWYSWILSSLTSFVYAFGFVMMTPQLYINYKLKSVAHLPWRAMVYKSLNTFVDDLFAFVIKMPWMHRLSCFRDDLIFFVYLYQRWAYPVDSHRTNEFGQGPQQEAIKAE